MEKPIGFSIVPTGLTPVGLQPEIIDYFKAMSKDTGIPYQNLITLYLLNCASEGRRLALEWRK